MDMTCVMVTLGAAGDEDRDKGNPDSSLLSCRRGAKIIKIGTLTLAAEWQKIRHASGAARDKGDLVFSSLLLLANIGGHELTFRQGGIGGEADKDGGRYGWRRTSGGRGR